MAWRWSLYLPLFFFSIACTCKVLRVYFLYRIVKQCVCQGPHSIISIIYFSLTSNVHYFCLSSHNSFFLTYTLYLFFFFNLYLLYFTFLSVLFFFFVFFNLLETRSPLFSPEWPLNLLYSHGWLGTADVLPPPPLSLEFTGLCRHCQFYVVLRMEAWALSVLDKQALQKAQLAFT